MKTLYLVRHAKSSWKDTSLDDFNRPLNGRGKRDAPFMGKLFAKKNIAVDLIISSPATRTIKTAQIIAEQISYKTKIKTEQKLYDAFADEILKVIQSVDSIYNSLVIVAHNPGLTSLSNQLIKEKITDIPTCGIVAIEFNNDWKDISEDSGNFIFYEYPKSTSQNNNCGHLLF